MSGDGPALEPARDVAGRIVAARLPPSELREEIIRALQRQRLAMMDWHYLRWSATAFAKALIRARRRAENRLRFALKQGAVRARRGDP